MEAKAEEVKDWLRERLLRTDEWKPRIRALEKVQVEFAVDSDSVADAWRAHHPHEMPWHRSQ